MSYIFHIWKYESRCLIELADTYFDMTQTHPPTKRPPAKEDARITKTRQKVLAAGAHLLFTEGWSEVTHLRLASETGVARGTLYRHWPRVDDLIVEVFETCDPTPYKAQRSGDLRTDLIAELELLSTNLRQTKLGDVILNAAHRKGTSPQMHFVHSAIQEIILGAFLDVLKDQNIKPNKTQTAQSLIGPVLYHHLFGADQDQLDVEKIVESFMAYELGSPV